MSVIEAKPVVDKKFWILQEEGNKVGNIEAEGSKFRVLFDNRYSYYKNIASIKADFPNIKFESGEILKATKPNKTQVYDFDVGCRAYNPVFDVKHQLPIFTKTSKSRSWHAAGWFAIRQHARFQVEHNPKTIMIERYEYHGPFQTEVEAAEYCI